MPPRRRAAAVIDRERKRIHAANSGSNYPNIRKLKRGRKAAEEIAMCYLSYEGRTGYIKIKKQACLLARKILRVS